MEVFVKTLPEFDRNAKRLAKKYKSFKADLLSFYQSLLVNPNQGVSLGKGGVHKVRMAVSSKGSGKSGGTRVLTYSVKISDPDVYEVTLMSIYDKSEIANVSNSYIEALVNEIIK